MFAVAMTFVNIVPLMTHQSNAVASATVTVGNVSPTMFCAGSNLSVPYTANSGFTTGNVFTAQLSNATGSFGSPVNIGSVTSTTSGTISTTIPLGTGAGTGYLIRIVSTSPSVTSINTSNTLIIYAVPSATISSQINVTCYGLNNGSAVVAPGGGVSPYSYLWMPGVETSAGILGLAPNNYVVTVTDSNGCTATTSATITQPAVLSASIPSGNITNVSCHGLTNGSAFVTVSGGTTPYSYFWYPSSQTVDTATGLAPGSYNVTVTDANGCTAIATSPSITQPSAALSVNIPPPNITNIPCFNGSTGSILANVSGGTPGYSYSWFPSAETTNPAINLMAGTYYVTVTDANGCTAVGGSATLHDLDTTALTATLWDTVIYSVGIAIVLPSGGSHPYTYLWSPTGATTQTIVSSEFGGNSVTVTDSNGCSYTITQPINLPDTEAIAGTTIFYPNLGQIIHTDTTSASEVKFYTLRNYPVNYFLQDSISYVFTSNLDSATHTDTVHRIDMTFVKGNTSNPMVINRMDSGGFLNYYLPQCPSGITNVHGFQYLLYPEIYNHIEALFTGNADGLKYYIIAMPGADTSQIELQYTGADSVTILVDGEQEIYSHFGSIKLAPPEVYQMDSSGARVDLSWASNYYLSGTGKIKFHLDTYDPNLPLIMQVDMKHIILTPTCPQVNMQWSTYVGQNSAQDYSTGITTDNVGSSYMIEAACGILFPSNVIGPVSTWQGGYDCAITKFKYTGNTVAPYNIVWTTFQGGTHDDIPNGISINNSGASGHEAYIVGTTVSSDFVTINSLICTTCLNQSTYSGSYDGFIIRLRDNGTCEWSSFIGGAGDDEAYGVLVNKSSATNVYVVGFTSSTGATTTTSGDFLLQNSPTGTYNQTVNNGTDAFIMRFDDQDNMKWSSFYGGNVQEEFFSITTLSNNWIVIGGISSSNLINAPLTHGPYTASNANTSSELQLGFPNFTSPSPYYETTYDVSGAGDALLVSFDDSDNLQWATLFGGDNTDGMYPNSLAADNGTPQNLYFLGYTNSSSGSLPLVTSTNGGNYNQTTAGGDLDMLIAEFDNHFHQEWTSLFGGLSAESGNGYSGLAISSDNRVFIASSTQSSASTSACGAAPTDHHFPVCDGNNCYYTCSFNGASGLGDAFIAGFDEYNNLFWSTYLNADNAVIAGLSVDKIHDRLYFTDAPVGINQLNPNSFPIYSYPNSNNPTYYNQTALVGYNDAVVGFFDISCTATGIKEITHTNVTNELIIYPNPSSGLFDLSLLLSSNNINENVIVKVRDVFGRQVLNENIKSNGSIFQTSLDISNFANGIYMIQVITNGTAFNKQIVKD